jgi:hypothetical protein
MLFILGNMLLLCFLCSEMGIFYAEEGKRSFEESDERK